MFSGLDSVGGRHFRIRVCSFCACAIPIVASLALAADKPDFSGKWELVVDKSDFGSLPKPARMTIESSMQGSAMRSTQTTYTGQDIESTEYTWFIDGKRHETDKPAPGYSITRWEDSALVTERASDDGAYQETSRLTLSRDRKTVTELVRVKSPNGTNKERLIWRKVGSQ